MTILLNFTDFGSRVLHKPTIRFRDLSLRRHDIEAACDGRTDRHMDTFAVTIPEVRVTRHAENHME